MSDTQINVGMNVDGVVAGTNKAKSELRTLQAEVDKVARASKEGGAALGKVGEGVDAEKAAKQLSRIAQQVKRVSDEAVLGRNSVELFAEKLAKTGVNAEVYRPLLDAYSQVRKSTEQTNAEFTKAGRVLDQYGNTAKGTAAALRQVPAQFTDIIVSLQGGQAPLTVLLQQGGQLKDVFGGVGNAAKALGGYVLGLVNPFTLAAGAVGLVGYAAYKSAEDAKELNKALALAGVSSGTTIGELSKVADAIKGTGTSGTVATAALVEFVNAGVKANSSLGDFVKTAIELERVGGPAVKETAKAFAELYKDPLKGLDDLTLATYKQIEALLEQGDKVGAAKVAQDAFNDASKNAVVQIEAQFGPLDRAAKYWKEVGVQAFYAAGGVAQALGLGSLTGNQERAKLQAQRDSYASVGYDTTELDKRLAYFTRLDEAQKQTAANTARELELKGLLANFDKNDESNRKLRERNQLITDNTKLLQANQITQQQFNAALKAFDAKGAKAPVKGANPYTADQDAAKAWAKYFQEFSSNAANAEAETANLTKSQETLTKFLQSPAYANMGEGARQLALQQAYAAIAGEQLNAVNKQATAENNKYVASLNESAASIEKKLTALGDETKAYGLSIEKNISLAEAIDLVAIARLEEQKAIELSYGDEKAVEAIEREIKARKELAKELNKKANHTAEVEAGKAAAKAATDEWKRGWEETDRIARDAFTGWAENGTSMAEAIGKSLKKALLSAIYEATLKPIAFQLYTSIAGGGGAAGAVQAASGALSGGSNPLSGITSALTGSFGLGMQGTIATIAEQGFIGGFSNAMTSAKTLASAGDFLGAAGSALPYAGAAIAGLAAIKALTDYTVKDNGSAIVANVGGGATNVANRKDYIQSSWRNGDQNNSEWSAASAELTAYMDAQVKLVTESARAYGTALGLPVADLDSFKQQIEVSLTGLNADQAKEAINKAIGGFGDALVSANFGPALDGLKLSGETSSATLVRVAAEITTVNGTLGMLGGKLLSVDAAGIKAADGLVQAMGGLEAFQQQTASYYSQYYSQEEQRMQTALSIQARLAQGGIDVSIEQVLNGTREQFRALVDSFKDGGGLMDEAGQKAVAALMAVAGAFAGITTASANVSASSSESTSTGATTESSFGSGVGTSGPSQSGGYSSGASEAANAILQERKTLQDELDNLTMTSTELLEKQRNALDESNRALFDQIQVAKEAARVAEQNKSLQDEYNQLTMTSAQLRALEREKIAEANLELFDRITALKAEQEAIATANNAVDAALAGVQRAIDAEKKSIEAARQAAQERVSILKSIVDSIGSAVDNLRGNVESTKAQAARQANAFIDNALATAQASGYMPDQVELKDAISKAMAGINREGLSQFEYEKQQLILAGKLESLGKIAKPQLSAAEEAVKVAETQLQVLDDTMEEARKQVDELRGIDTSVKSVEAAIAALTAAILASITAQGASYRPTPNTPLPNVGGIKQQGLTYAEMQAHAVNLSNWNANPIDAGTALYNAAVRYGYTSDDLDRAMGWTSGHSLEWALSHGLAAFDVGTNMVPRDMIAQIHEGEAIIPKAYNPAAGGVSGNARLESLVEGLTKEVQRLQAIVNDGNKSNERIATAVNGQPDRPMLVETVV